MANENDCYQLINGEYVRIGTLKRITVKREFNPHGMTKEELASAVLFSLTRLKEDFQYQVDRNSFESNPVEKKEKLVFLKSILLVEEKNIENGEN